jgi:predicted alpha/beta hydrolase
VTAVTLDSSSEWWTPTSEGHELHVAELRPTSSAPNPPGILFVHGVFSDGRFFLGRQGGATRFFAERGFAGFVADLRGHGASRRPASARSAWGFDAYARDDIPALVRAVKERHPGPLFVVAHSMGGYATLAGLSLDRAAQQGLRGIVVLSTAVNDFTDGGFAKVVSLRFSSALGSLLGRFPARALRQGPSDEPAQLMREFVTWAKSESFRSGDGTIDYFAALQELSVPVLSLVGEADRFHASPRRAEKLFGHIGAKDKELVVCGPSRGFGVSFGHVDIVRGADAERDVLPRVHAWMEKRLPA